MMSKKAGSLCAFLILAAAGALAQPSVGLRVGNIAPDFSVTRIDGSTIKLSDLRGKPVMINFWATWCPPCVKELPYIANIAQNRSDEITVLIISVENNEKTISDYLRSQGGAVANLNSGYDLDGSISQLYRTYAVPMTLFLDENGVITGGQSGAYTEKRLTAAVDKAVKKS